MKPYIYGARNGIYVLDLRKTTGMLDEAYAVVREFSARNKNILFVGTKKQASEAIKRAAISCGMPYVNHRWLGGMLTNFGTIKKSIRKLEIIKKMREEGQLDLLTKKEALMLSRKEEKLELYLGGIKEMHKLPDMMFVLDAVKEKIAIQEARRLGITVVAPLDTNCDPDVVDLPIPGNDDAIRSIHLFCNEMAAAMNEGKAALADETGVEAEPVTVEETEALIAEAVAEGEEFAFETEEA
jgi:small subunit ribosomal protein S2